MTTASTTDYIGMWFRSRARQGVTDVCDWLITEPDGRQHYYEILHREHDGIGALFHLLRRWGAPQPALPLSRQRQAPSIWQWLRPGPSKVATAPPAWRYPRQAEPCGGMQARCLERDLTTAIKQQAHQQGVSLNAWLLICLHRAVEHTLLRTPVTGTWMYPVNMRGAVTMPRDDMNLSSGFYLPVGPEDDARSVYQRSRRYLASNAHWRYWHMARIGRFIGERGVDWLCRRLLKGKQHLGSFSNLGEWQLDLKAAGFDPESQVVTCGPGSPSHPVGTGILTINGRLSLALRVHASQGIDDSQCRQCLTQWVNLAQGRESRE